MQRRPLPPHRRAATLSPPLVLSILLAACASAPKTRPPDPGVEVPVSWTAVETTEDGTEEDTQRATEFPDDDWWRGFDDPELDRLVEQALERNGDLAAAAARIDQASAQARIAGADPLPGIDAAGNGARQRQNFIGFPIRNGLLEWS
jgi:multidrug efflux system outer membrane protein